MMLDAEIVAVSPSGVWRALGQAGLLAKWNGRPSKKGTGFQQPLAAHQHWHIEVSYINICGTFYPGKGVQYFTEGEVIVEAPNGSDIGGRSHSLPKVATGNPGLDKILLGGLPAGRMTLLTGGAGCGKTIIGLEYLVRGAEAGEAGILVPFEERTEAFLRYVEIGGETNRVLSAIRSRGSYHSNQLREFRITSRAVEILPVYAGEGGMLTGAARQEEEQNRLTA